MNVERLRAPLRWCTGLSFAAVGVTHFTHGELFVAIMPPALPWHLGLVWLSGIFEILGVERRV